MCVCVCVCVLRKLRSQAIPAVYVNVAEVGGVFLLEAVSAQLWSRSVRVGCTYLQLRFRKRLKTCEKFLL